MSKMKPRSTVDGIPVWCQHDKLVNTDSVQPNPKNPNKHPERQIHLLGKTIKKFGWRNPITVSKRSGMIVAGHGRLMAAQHLGLSQVPVDYQDFADEKEELAVLVADNRLAEIGDGWDWEVLRGELDLIIEGGEIDLSEIGFSVDEIPSIDQEEFGGDADGSTSGEKSAYLSFCGQKAPLTDEEQEGMLRLLNQHIEETGSTYGFAAYIIEKCSI